jgi:hypothetical protein
MDPFTLVFVGGKAILNAVELFFEDEEDEDSEDSE